MPSFHFGEVSIAYADVVLAASGGVPPYFWSIGAGALPGGLTLSSQGTISGIPTTAGTYTFSVVVTDSAKSTAGGDGSIGIAQYLIGNGLCMSTCQVEQGCVSVCGTYARPTGGVAPFTYKLTSGALPPATTLGWPALGGQFTTTSTYSFTVVVYDSLGAKTDVSALFNVVPHIWIEAGLLTNGYLKQPYSASISYGGGLGTPKVITAKGALPPGLGAYVDSKSSKVVIWGTPTTTGTYTLILQLTDASPCGPGYNCSATSQPLSITIPG